MSILAQPTEAPTASPAPREQSLSIFVLVEIMNDLDDGTPTLCTATEPNLGDFRKTSPARALAMLDDAQTAIAAMKRTVKEFEARDTLAAILTEHDLTLVEAPLDKLADINDSCADIFGCWVVETADGCCYVVVPAGQTAIARLHAVAAFIGRREQRAE